VESFINGSLLHQTAFRAAKGTAVENAARREYMRGLSIFTALAVNDVIAA
jgi:hypothetical protein